MSKTSVKKEVGCAHEWKNEGRDNEHIYAEMAFGAVEKGKRPFFIFLCYKCHETKRVYY